MAINVPNNLVYYILSIIRDGKDKVVTPIINAKTVPMPTPLATKASAIGIVPKISA